MHHRKFYNSQENLYTQGRTDRHVHEDLAIFTATAATQRRRKGRAMLVSLFALIVPDVLASLII